MLEKFVVTGLPVVELYFTSFGLLFKGVGLLINLGEEFRSLRSFICCRSMLLFDDGKGNGVVVRNKDGEDGIGKGFSLQQTESTFIEGG